MKKILSLILIFTLVVPSLIVSTGVSYAGSVDSKELAEAIAVVKRVVEIPENLSEFNYYYSEYDEESQKEANLCLEWSDPDDYGYIATCVSKQGDILYYHSNLPEFKGSGLAKVTKEEAEKISRDYLKKFKLKGVGEFKLEESSTDGYGNVYRFTYKMYVNDIPCDFANVTISINKYVGKLVNYSYDNNIEDISIKDFPTKDGTIDFKEAKNIYLSKLGPELTYLSNYDYYEKSLKVFTAYVTDNSKRAIDANTGEIVKLYEDYIIYRNMENKQDAKEELSSDATEEIEYTEEELKEIENVENLIDKEKAVKIARELVPSIGNEKLKSSKLMKYNGPDRSYNWYLNFENNYVRIDASKGILISFNGRMNYDENNKSDIGLEKAKAISEKFLDKVCADKKEEIALTNEDTAQNSYSGYTFIYTRQVNDIDFGPNSIYISIDKSNGHIVSYSRNWYETAVFPDLKNSIKQEKAFDIVSELGSFELVYKRDFEGNIILVYDFLEDENYFIDAYKGIRLDYKGDAYKEVKQNDDYTDIKGNWAEDIIKKLKDNGYYLEGNKFEPKSATTQIDFFKYLYSPSRSYYLDDEEFYEMLINQKIIEKEEIKKDSYLSRKEAAKFITRYLGVDKLAKEASVFKNIYKDDVDKEYLGYASAVYAMGIMKGDLKGRFNGDKTLTHAETAVVIYNILSNQ